MNTAIGACGALILRSVSEVEHGPFGDGRTDLPNGVLQFHAYCLPHILST